jgi:hypothetical protein
MSWKLQVRSWRERRAGSERQGRPQGQSRMWLGINRLLYSVQPLMQIHLKPPVGCEKKHFGGRFRRQGWGCPRGGMAVAGAFPPSPGKRAGGSYGDRPQKAGWSFEKPKMVFQQPASLALRPPIYPLFSWPNVFQRARTRNSHQPPCPSHC